MGFARYGALGCFILMISGVAPARAEEQRALAERIPSVTHRAFEKRGRIEVVPQLGLSLNDPFYTQLMTGGGLRYYLSETLAFGVFGERYKSYATQPDVAAGGLRPVVDYNAPHAGGHVEVLWAPIYGKMSLFAENVLHFDMYVSGGAGAMLPRQGGAMVEGVVAVGQHYVFNSFTAIQLELRDSMFSLARDPAVSTHRALQHALSASIALSFFLPSMTRTR